MITNDSRVRYRLAHLMAQIGHLPRTKQDELIAAELERSHAAGELSKPAELVDGKWRLHVAADVRSIDVTFVVDDDKENDS